MHRRTSNVILASVIGLCIVAVADVGVAHANYAYGKITVNGAPPATGTVVTAIDTRTGSSYAVDADGTDAAGNYQTTLNNPIYAGSVSLQINGQTRSCPCTSDGINNYRCDADISGCGSSATVTMTGVCMVFTFPAGPSALKRLRHWRRARRGVA